ncbi:uncharacterized protein LOC144746954 [Ciona intestinalis]
MQILQLSPGKIIELDLRDKRLTESTTQALLPHLDVMDKLDLDEEKLSTQHLIILHEAVEQITNPQALTVNGINGDRWSKYWKMYNGQPDEDVMQILQLPTEKIKSLEVLSLKITDSTTQALLPHLEAVNKLNLDERKISVKNRILLHEAVGQLTNPQSLTLDEMSGNHWSKYWKIYRDQPDDDVMQILQVSPGKIRGINLKYVKMTDSMIQALLPHLDQIDLLYLDEKNLSTQHLLILHEAVGRRNNPQAMTVNGITGGRWSTYWKVHEKHRDEDVMQILQLPPGKVKELVFTDVEITDSMTQALLPHLDVAHKLDLDEKKLSVENLIILHEAVEQIPNPQGLKVNGINGDQWSMYWEVHRQQPDQDVMKILQLSPGKIKVLDVKGRKMSDSTTQALLPHIDVMDKLDLVSESESNDMNPNPYMEDISRKIVNRHNKIEIGIDAPLNKNATCWLGRCLSNVSNLEIKEKKLSTQNLIVLHEAVEQLTNPQDLTVNGINGDRWSKYWIVHGHQTDDDVMQILQLQPGKVRVAKMLIKHYFTTITYLIEFNRNFVLK